MVAPEMLQSNPDLRREAESVQFLSPLDEHCGILLDQVFETKGLELARATFDAIKVHMIDLAIAPVFVDQREGRAVHLFFRGST